VVDLRGTSLVWYFGKGTEVSISRDIESIGPGCFHECECLVSVSFESGCKISHLGESAFRRCLSLQSICIPSSIETISRSCFNNCWRLSNLTFEAGCQISNFEEDTFGLCSSLQSICIPSSVERICSGCFYGCSHLSDVTFEPGSRVSSLGAWAFADCLSLRWPSLPSSVQEIAILAFCQYSSRSRLDPFRPLHSTEIHLNSVETIGPPAGSQLQMISMLYLRCVFVSEITPLATGFELVDQGKCHFVLPWMQDSLSRRV
jgi:hypothetical protein